MVVTVALVAGPSAVAPPVLTWVLCRAVPGRFPVRHRGGAAGLRPLGWDEDLAVADLVVGQLTRPTGRAV